MTTETDDPKNAKIDTVKHVGLMMREAREKAGYSIERAAMSTRISPAFIEALEQEKFEVLPGVVFGRGFIRNLCRTYAADANGMIKAFEVSLEQKAHSESSQPFREPRTQIRVKEALAVVGGIEWKNRVRESVGNYYSKGKPFFFMIGCIVLGIYAVRTIYNRGSEVPTPAPSNVAATITEAPAPTQLPVAAIPEQSPPTAAPVTATETAPFSGVVRGEGVEFVEILIKEPVNIGMTRDRDRQTSELMPPAAYRLQFNEQLRLYVENMDAVEIRFKGQPIPSRGIKGERRFMTFSRADVPIAKSSEKTKL